LTLPSTGKISNSGYDWTFGTDGNLSLPNSAVIGQASDVEITVAATAYTDSLTAWESVRASYQAQADGLGITSAGWPFIAWNATGTTAAGFLSQLSTAMAIQNSAPSSPPTPLIFQPAISAAAYYEIRDALAIVRDSYANWQALLTSVEITSGTESITLLANGKLQVPNIIQTDPEEDLVIRTRYAVASSPPGTPAYANRNFTFGTNGNLTLETGIASAGGSLWITPQSAVSSKRFNFNVNSSGATFTSAWLEMPWAENNKQVGQQFYHSNNTVGNLWNQGTDTIGLTNFNNAFNILGLRTDIKLTAEDSSSNRFTWTFDKTGILTVPGSIIGTATQNVFNTTSTTVNAFGAATTALNIGASGAPITGFAATATTASTASSLGYLGLPQSTITTTNTLTIADAGKHIYVKIAGQVITIPDNGVVPYPIGTTITFIAGTLATTVTIANNDTMILAGGELTGTRTLAANGMATAVKVASTRWYINGVGLT